MHEIVYEGQAGGLAEPSAEALFGHAGDVGDFAEGDGVLVVVLDVFRDAFHSSTELLTHDVGIGVVCGDSEEVRTVGDHGHEVEKCADAAEGVFADDGGEGLVFGGVELAQINAVAHGAEQALKRGALFEAVEPFLGELEPPAFFFHLDIFLLRTDEIMG